MTMADSRATEMPYITASLVIEQNGLDTNLCTISLGLEPTSVWRLRDKSLADHHEIYDTNWILELPERESYNVDDTVKELINLLWPHRNRLLSFLESSGAEASVICNIRLGIHGERPVYELRNDTIRKLGELQCHFMYNIT